MSINLLIGLCCVVSGGGLLAIRHRSRIAAASLLMLLGGSVASAQDPDFTVARSAPRASVSVVATDASPQPLNWSALSAPARAVSDRSPIDWTACEGGVCVPRAQCLVFVRPRNCSDCERQKSYIEKTLPPLGWSVGPEPDADFRVIDVLKHQDLVTAYGVHVVPTTIYINRSGKEVERFEGFPTPRNLTTQLNQLR